MSSDSDPSRPLIPIQAGHNRPFAEAYRVLRPGGRMVVADMLLGGLIFIQVCGCVVDTPKPRQGGQEIGSATGLYLDLGFNTHLTQRQ